VGGADQRRAPLQSSRFERRPDGSVDRGPGGPDHPAGTISWAEHEKAWRAYSAEHGDGQTADRMAERGGFGWYEICALLGHEPTTWQPRATHG
jgi:hypothetical protein